MSDPALLEPVDPVDPGDPVDPVDRTEASDPSDADPGPAAGIAEAVLALPGVARLEPTLTTAVRRLSPAAGTDVDGVTVSHQNGRTSVSVDLATDGSLPALGVADEARRAIVTVMDDRRSSAEQAVGKIAVNVLTIEMSEGVPGSTA